MPIYVESRNLNIPVVGGLLGEHQYLIYVPVGEELNYDAWQYIGAFPGGGDGSLLNGVPTTDILFTNADDDRWTTADFPSLDVAAVAIELGIAFSDVTVKEMVDKGYAGTAESIRHRETVSTLNDVNIGSETGNDLWNFLVATANDISNKYTYNAEGNLGVSGVYGPAANSNSFISSILKHAQAAGYNISAFNTDAHIPGSTTWLGTTGNDVLNGNTTFTNGDEAQNLFGGEGTDTLIAGTGDSYLVAGADTDRDILIGNAGDDILVGYYNQANYANSDSMSGGGGDDEFIIIDHASALAGGIPDANGTPAAPTNFVHDGTSSGDAVLVDGGSGIDILDFSNITNDVTIDFTNGSIVNVEKYVGSAGSDTVFADEIALNMAGGEGTDTLSYEKAGEGIDFILHDTNFFSSSTARSAGLADWVTYFSEFENIVGTAYDDTVKIEFMNKDRKINGGDDIQAGDTLDFSSSDSFLTIDLTPVDAGFASIYVKPYGTTLLAGGFENVIGTGFGDIITGTDAQNTIRGGNGEDVIFGGLGNDFSDGGADSDTLDYAALGLNFTFALDAPASGGADAVFTATPDSGGWVDRFTDFETAMLSTQDTTLTINGANTLDALNVEAITVDGYTGSNSLDLGGVEQGVTADLGAGTLNVTGGTTGMTITNFEKVIGTAQVDTITGDDQANWIDGGAGADVIDGGAGTDVLHFDRTGAGVTVDLVAGTGLGGDADGDTYRNIEVVIGTNSSDTFTGKGELRFSGGQGDDNFFIPANFPIPSLYSAKMPTIVWGGEGADMIHIDTLSLAIVVVQIDNLTADKFASFELDDLQLDGFINWSGVSLVIVNPDSADRIFMGTSNSTFATVTFGEFGYNNLPDSFVTSVSSVDNNTQGPGGVFNNVGDYQSAYFSHSGGELVPSIWVMAGGAIVGPRIVADALGTEFTAQIAGANAESFDSTSAGSDLVGYSSSKSGIELDLGLGTGSKGYAKGDTYVGIKNISGSKFDDIIKGNASANKLTGNAGNDVLNGESGNDILEGGVGNDTIIGGGGDDTIAFTGGNDTIAGRFNNYGNDTLDLSQYTAAQVSFVNSGVDIIITTPDGSITLQSQIRADVGHAQSNIENIIFSDGTLDEAGIRDRAVADQSTAGNDAIVATKFDDVINGGAGDDHFTGGSGADIIELDFGSGSDVMTDFEDGLDIIDLSATGLVFSDLIITANASGDAVISFDDGDGATALDELTLTGITTDKLTAEDFQFG